ncbi:hypothetical protein [Acinetobacter indicus]|uniref:Uncharacterized protein n=1 Tax=Acinetobacter indicus CIP 110367 TaxID=1341679 RepID=V2UMA5_9GAMM|nr:hypothetical protein [Acinetobacter indicus]EPF75429.1 hypothetical protein F956_00329 [Acinetobacter indicus ANC 4215]ESK49741.1 hypothetical protein P253_00598 [Acinetobacter indicus CIP 110367]
MIWIAVIGLLWLSCLGFYTVSEKQIIKTRTSRYALLSVFPVLVKLTSGTILCMVMLLLSTQFSESISFVSLWVLLSPVLFVFIVKMNHLGKKL